MVKLNKIYTKTGDDGTTGLVRGPRRSKYDLRVEAFGTVDEANSFIGMARLHTGSMPKVDRLLARIQNDLFDLGSDLATPGADPAGAPPSLRITAGPDRMARTADRPLQRRPEAADQLRPARRHAAGGGAARRPHRGAPRRAAGGRTDRHGARHQHHAVTSTSTACRTCCSSWPASPMPMATRDVLWTPGKFSSDPQRSIGERAIACSCRCTIRTRSGTSNSPMSPTGCIALNVLVFLIQLAPGSGLSFNEFAHHLRGDAGLFPRAQRRSTGSPACPTG